MYKTFNINELDITEPENNWLHYATNVASKKVSKFNLAVFS